MSSFFEVCPRCSNVVKRCTGFNLYNNQYCSNCGLAYKDFPTYIRLIRTVGTGDYCNEGREVSTFRFTY